MRTDKSKRNFEKEKEQFNLLVEHLKKKYENVSIMTTKESMFALMMRTNNYPRIILNNNVNE